MKFLRILLLGLALDASLVVPMAAQDSPEAAPAPNPVLDELQALMLKVQGRLRTGATTAAALAPELAEFDALLVKYPEKSESTARVAFIKTTLYVQVFQDEGKAKELLVRLKADFPGTQASAAADRLLDEMTPEGKARVAARKAVPQGRFAALVGRPAPELNFAWSSRSGPAKLSDLRGQVVVLDFWATWCGPCISSFPQMREHVARFQGMPVVFLGVTSLQGRVMNLEAAPISTKGDPAKEYGLMPAFMKAHAMTWDVVFSTQNVFNPDYGIRGIPSLTIVAPDGTVRHAGLHPGMKEADIAGKIEALLKEFNLPLPPTAG